MVIKQREEERIYSSSDYINKSRRVYEAPDPTLFNNLARSKQVYPGAEQALYTLCFVRHTRKLVEEVERKEAEVVVRRIKVNRGERRVKPARAGDIARTHVNSLVPRGSASVTTWRAIVQREVAAKIETMSVEWDREDTGGTKGEEEGGYRLNRKPSPEQLLHRRFTWPTFTAPEVTLISLCVSAGALAL
ncbi:hypothetical protein K0M31_007789 [Melipona bicolor]|uniref:Uncharacterized protein n=1 Tax=Melipona bicolor TaxID=60889 RepID=A0AA40KVZ1_9HYME|nr:hypothetical protein K0M31_007789 [Melipona bicolor]